MPTDDERWESVQRALVLAAARLMRRTAELGFHPSDVARDLEAGECGVVDFLEDAFEDELGASRAFDDELEEQIERELEADGPESFEYNTPQDAAVAAAIELEICPYCPTPRRVRPGVVGDHDFGCPLRTLRGESST